MHLYEFQANFFLSKRALFNIKLCFINGNHKIGRILRFSWETFNSDKYLKILQSCNYNYINQHFASKISYKLCILSRLVWFVQKFLNLAHILYEISSNLTNPRNCCTLHSLFVFNDESRVASDIRPFLYPVSGQISGLIFRISGR